MLVGGLYLRYSQIALCTSAIAASTSTASAVVYLNRKFDQIAHSQSILLSWNAIIYAYIIYV